MLIIESKQFFIPVVYHSHLIYFIGFWNEIGKVFIPSMEVLEFIKLYKTTKLSASINPKSKLKRGVYHVFIFRSNVDRSLPKFVLVKQGKFCKSLERYWNMTLNKQDADNRK